MLVTSLMKSLVINHSANTEFLMHRKHDSDALDLAVGKTKSCLHDSRRKTGNPTFMYIYLLCCVLLVQSYPTLCSPLNSSLPGSSVYGILQARILEWVAKPSSRGSSQPRDRTQVSCIVDSLQTETPANQTRVS